MNFESKFRVLRLSSLAVAVFALLLTLAGLAQLGLGGMAVSAEYERIAQREAELERPGSYYGYQRQWRQAQAEYDRSSSAFFLEGRFLQTSLGEEESTVAVTSLVVFAVSVLGFLTAAMVWVWRAHANIREVGIRSKYGPEFAVAGYLIPLANLVIPFEAMRELHNRSHGEVEDFAHSPVENVTAWWTSVLVGLLIFSALMAKFIVDAGTNLILMTPLWMEFAILCFAFVLLFTGAWLFAGLTRTITAAQIEVLPELDLAHVQEEAPQRPSVKIVGG